jgi:hypothetical protein
LDELAALLPEFRAANNNSKQISGRDENLIANRFIG